MKKRVCIHGHFYQPPRANPWLEFVEEDESAFPFHDWNERVFRECYAPNSAARIVDGRNRILDICDNYSQVSFNFGPTLLSWMADREPEVYQAILESDRKSLSLFGGHGSAIAQGYNHMIMPLANARDKETQVIWGIGDFEKRFKRKPEGMWLPETAADTLTLESLAEKGIQFTILAPSQAKEIRKIDNGNWVSPSSIGNFTHQSYLCRLPSGRSIVLFFYDGAISRDIAFGSLLNSGESFAERLIAAFSQSDEDLVNIAVDGETFGHHHRFGDMALAACLLHLKKKKVELVNYGQFLASHTPKWEARIWENSSWSCAHGVERWRSDCGCKMNSNWNQKWRSTLRGTMDWLRDQLIPLFEKESSLKDPWAARNDYIEVVLDREKSEDFLKQHASKNLTESEKVRVLSLLEMQRHAMLMYTSCGWFFDEISSIEPCQVMLYAARAMQLAKKLGLDLENEFISRLQGAKSNIKEYGDGAAIYKKIIKPKVSELVNIGEQFAVSSFFEKSGAEKNLFCYKANIKDELNLVDDERSFRVGEVEIISKITFEKESFRYAVYFGDEQFFMGISSQFEDTLVSILEEAKRIFSGKEIERFMREFFPNSFLLTDIFKDQRRSVLNWILKETSVELENMLEGIISKHYALLNSFSYGLPMMVKKQLDIFYNMNILNLLREEDLDRLARVVRQVVDWKIELDKANLGLVAEGVLNKMVVSDIDKAIRFLEIVNPLGLRINLWKAQNITFFKLKKSDSLIRLQKLLGFSD